MISMVNETSKLLETALPVTYFKYTMDLFFFFYSALCPNEEAKNK